MEKWNEKEDIKKKDRDEGNQYCQNECRIMKETGSERGGYISSG